jgi:aspartate racemase
MEKLFYRDRLAAQGIEATIPDRADRDRLHAIIFEELVVGDIRLSSKAETLAMYAKARDAGCDGVIFGCTEIGMIIAAQDFDIPVFDTTLLHTEAAIAFAAGSG